MPLALTFKINVPKTETMINLKSASFVVIMLLHEGLTHIQSQIKPRLLFGESFALMLTYVALKILQAVSLELSMKSTVTSNTGVTVFFPFSFIYCVELLTNSY